MNTVWRDDPFGPEVNRYVTFEASCPKCEWYVEWKPGDHARRRSDSFQEGELFQVGMRGARERAIRAARRHAREGCETHEAGL